MPPTTRGWVWHKVAAVSHAARVALFFCGRAAWTVSVSALLVSVPWALAWSEEQNLLAMEQEQRMREMGGELLTAPGGGENTADAVSAALGREGGGQVKAAL